MKYIPLLLLCSCATQYVPTSHIEMSCTLPTRCQELKPVSQTNAGQDIYDDFIIGNICIKSTNLYIDCMEKIK